MLDELKGEMPKELKINYALLGKDSSQCRERDGRIALENCSLSMALRFCFSHISSFWVVT